MAKPQHLLSSQDIDRHSYDEIMRRAEVFLDQGIPPRLMAGRVLATLFYQRSTRTQARFQAAIIRSGGGNKEHALGAGFMLFNMKHYLGDVEGARVGFYGNAQHSRCSKALLPILGHYATDVFVDDLDGHFAFPQDVERAATSNGMRSIQYGRLDEFINELDWLIVCDAIPAVHMSAQETQTVKALLRPIGRAEMAALRSDAWLDMIPPCEFEVARDVFEDPRTVFTKKEIHVEYALALMTYFLGVDASPQSDGSGVG